jgi:serine/threonine protein kinase
MAISNNSGRRSDKEIFFQALEKATPDERATFLDQACGDDPLLRQRVEELLANHFEQDNFMQKPAVDVAAVGKPASPLSESPGTLIGRYKLLQKIGEGGMGVVYMAEQEEPVRRKVALKIIKLGMDTKLVVARFEAERQALALMDHPNIARVLDGGATETGRPYFVMELVQGVPITEFCDKNHLSTEQRLKLFIPVCQSIQSAHQKGIIHRDLKPTNILVTLNPDGSGFPKVIDFGVAKATSQKLTEKTLFTAHGMMVGTPAYMSPEQAEMSRMDVDTRADIYSLGALLYELLTGTPPFPEQRLRSAGYNEMQRIILEEKPERPSTRLSTLQGEQRSVVARNRGASELALGRAFPGDLDWIVMKCLEKDRARRYETANGLAHDIGRHLRSEPITARPPSRLYAFQKTLRRHWVGFAAVAAVLVAFAIGMLFSALEAVRARRAESLAKERLAESQAVLRFTAEVFANADPARNSRTITVAESLGAAARRLETDVALQPGSKARLQENLAWTYHTLGLNEEAIPLGEKARDYCLANLGPESPDTLLVLNNLAIYYDEGGRPAEALKLKEQVLALRRKVSGPEDPETLRAMNNLANAYRDAGRLAQATTLLEQALALRRKVSGPEHPETLLAMRNLASCYDHAGRREEALKLREQVLMLRRKVSGPEHPETLAAMSGLGISYFEAGRLEEVLKLQEEVLALSRKVMGPEHPHTLIYMQNLADSYEAAGRLEETLKLQEEVLARRRKVLGHEHPDTLESLNAVAWILATSPEPGIRNGTNAMNFAEAAVAATHRTNAGYLDTLAAAYAEAQQFDRAVAAERQAINLEQTEAEKTDCGQRLKLYQENKPYRVQRNP